MPILKKFKLLIYLSVIFSACFLTNLSYALNDLSYNIQFVDKPKAELKINAHFHAGQTEKTLLHIPSEGVTHLTAKADNLPTKIIKNPADPAGKTCYVLHRPGASIKLSYNIIQVFPDPPTSAALWHALLKPTYFYFLGQHAFIWPEQAAEDIQLSLQWVMPLAVKNFNSFGIQQRTQTIYLKNIDDLKDSLFVGGDFRLYTNQQDHGQVVYTVMRGKWPFSDEEYVKQINKTFSAVNQFWPTDHPKTLLNALLPVAPLAKIKPSSKKLRIGMGGRELYNAYVLMSDVPQNIDAKNIDRMWEFYNTIAAHEYNHHWIPRYLVKMDDKDLGGKWFSEGLNEYVAQRARFRAHAMSLKKYVQHFNNVVAEYFTSPAFGEQIDVGKFPPLNMETVFSIKQPYCRGELLAWRWAIAVQGAQAIDLTLLNILKDAKMKRIIFSDNLLSRYLSQAGVVNSYNDIKQYARHGDEIPLNGTELGPCVKAKKIPMQRYDIGFDLQKSKKEKKIVGLKFNGPASKAGLKEGDEFSDLQYAYGNTHIPVKITLSYRQKIITYDPVKPIQVFRYTLKPMKTIPSSCYSHLLP